MQVCVLVFVCLSWMLVWLLFSKKTGGFLPLALPPFPPFIMVSWVQTDSSSCLFCLIYQARTDKCKHLPGYPPHLGARGGWMCSIFIPIRWINALFSPGCLSNLLCSWSNFLLLSHLDPNATSSGRPVNRRRCGRRWHTPSGLAIRYLCGCAVEVSGNWCGLVL